jgi:hypothetical protein
VALILGSKNSQARNQNEASSNPSCYLVRSNSKGIHSVTSPYVKLIIVIISTPIKVHSVTFVCFHIKQMLTLFA